MTRRAGRSGSHSMSVTWSPTLRFLAAGAIASVVAGIPAGLAARLAMAVLADAGGTSMTAVVGQVTVLGTIRIAILPMFFGIPFAWLLLWAGGHWSGQPWPIRIAAYAIGALLVPGLLILSDSEFNVAGANKELGRWLFIPTFVIYGAIVGLVGERLLGRTRGMGRSSESETSAPRTVTGSQHLDTDATETTRLDG